MIKGCRKRMVIVSGLNDSSIEVAYFVMKDNENAENLSDDDIVKKANSIVENSMTSTVEFNLQGKNGNEKGEKNSQKNGLLFFFLGLISGGTAVAMMTLFFEIL